MSGKKLKITSRGALLVVDVAAVDRVWSGMSARDAIEGIRAGTLAPRTPSRAPPAPPGEKKLTGLDVALRQCAMKKLADRPLTENLRAKRALGIPWRWLSRAPDRDEERRIDDRLVRWAEIARVHDLTADEILAITSAAERTMIGAAEVKDAFARWGTPAFGDAILALRDDEVPEILVDAWGDAAPLLAVMGFDEEDELWAAIRRRLDEVRAAITFAREERLAVLPWLKERWNDFLDTRAAARG